MCRTKRSLFTDFARLSVAVAVFGMLGLANPSSAVAGISDSLQKELSSKVETHLSAEHPEQRQAALMLLGHLDPGNSQLAKLKHLSKTADATAIRLGAAIGLMYAGHDDLGHKRVLKALQNGAKPMGVFRRDLAILPDSHRVHLFKRLVEEDKSLRGPAMRYLANQNGALRDLFAEYLQSHNQTLRKEAIKAARGAPSQQLSDTLGEMVQSSSSAVRSDGLELLLAWSRDARLEAVAADLLQKHFAEFGSKAKRKVARRLIELGYDKGTPHLVNVFLNGDKETRVELGGFLLEHRIEVPFDKIEPELAEAEGQTYRSILYSLATIAKGEKFLDKLKELFDSTEFEDRLVACRAFGFTGSQDVFPDLKGALFEGDATMRLYAAKSLGALGLPKALGALKRALGKEPERRVKFAVIDAIAEIGGKKARNTLQFQIKTADRRIKRHLLEALETFDGLDSSTLQILLADSDRKIRWKAYLLLAKTDQDAALSQLQSALQRPPMGYIKDLEQLPNTPFKRELFERMLTSKKRSVRLEATSAAARVGPFLAPALREVLESEKAPVSSRAFAAAMLAQYGETADKARFEKLLRSDDLPTKLARRVGWGLTSYRTKSLEASFRGYLDHSDKVVRAIAAYGLGHIQ